MGWSAAVDDLAAGAGVAMLESGGTAADAAIAASAVLSITCQPLCGMGGDLMAVVHPGHTGSRPRGQPVALNASGRAGSGADADGLRAQGLTVMPYAEDIRCVPVPGCVDGWLALHDRFGRLEMSKVLEPACSYAERGFPASPVLAGVASDVAGVEEAPEFEAPVTVGDLVRRPRLAAVLREIVTRGRDGFYEGRSGGDLLSLGAGEFAATDLRRHQADWVPALEAEAWGHRLWTVPPNSQGYLTLAGAWIATGLPLPALPEDGSWAHLLIESARQAAFDRNDVLHEAADGAALLEPDRLGARRDLVDAVRSTPLGAARRGGDTVAICAVDSERQGVSLLQSIFAQWGSRIALPGSGIFLHNRGSAFSLVPGHPAEYTPGRRPPHTLSPAVATDPAGGLRCVTATMGGDSQPQILLQLLARLLHNGEDPASALAAGRWVLESTAQGWDILLGTWGAGGEVTVSLEGQAPDSWRVALAERGHRVATKAAFSHDFGHAHLIELRNGVLAGASDPRPRAGSAACW